MRIFDPQNERFIRRLVLIQCACVFAIFASGVAVKLWGPG